MSKKMLNILCRLSKDLKDKDFDSEKILEEINPDESDLAGIREALEKLEFPDDLDEDSLDIFKVLLVYIFIREGSYDKEDVYSLVFGDGKRILWN